MMDYQYLIIGGGMTADAAVKGIRQVDEGGSIGLISAEPDPPYDRPPLSKGLWRGKEVGKIWRNTEAHGVKLHLSRRATELDPGEHTVTDDGGETYRYQRLLLATGGRPRQLPSGPTGVIYFRTFQDYQRLQKLAASVERFAVVGGGFIGSELAAELALQDKRVTMIFPEEAIGAGRFPSDLAASVTDYYRSKGVRVLSGQLIESVKSAGDRTQIRTDGGEEVEVDAVVAGLGIRPNTELAEAAGLAVQDGIVVDSGLQASKPDIFAAGDVANFHNPALGQRLRVEHEDNANRMGEAAGRAMAGESVSYDHLPFFYSDLFDLGYEAVGPLDSRLETRAQWLEPYRKGIVYYLEDRRIRGVLLWNVWGQVEAATQLIAAPGPIDEKELLPLSEG